MSTWEPDQPGVTADRPGIIRSLIGSLSESGSALVGRSQLANLSGFSFRGARDMFRALGYPRVLTPRMYRWRYERGGIVARLIESKPVATWRGGGELIEDEDPNTETEFEAAWSTLNKRLSIWQVLERADILAGLGRFSVVLIGAPGELSTPLTRLPIDRLAYLTPFSERDATIENLDIDTASPRFGHPIYYAMNRLTSPLQGISASMARRVHWTRVIHIADGLLDDNIYGQPRLDRIWNLLDDLDKVVGGGAEAFWKRIDAGMQLKLDPSVGPMSPEDKVKLDEQLDEYVHGLRRVLRTRGVDIETLTSAVGGIKDPMQAIISLLSAATSIPQRILLGSERGELASSQDRDEWDERISDRRTNFANTICVRPLIDRLIALGTLPVPAKYEARWPTKEVLNPAELVNVAKDAANINQLMGETVVTADEIRDRYLDLPPLSEVAPDSELPAPLPGGAPTAAKRVISPARRAAKWACLSRKEKDIYYVAHRALRKKTAAPTIPGLVEALEADDLRAAERLIVRALHA